jgi:hypothetical protein
LAILQKPNVAIIVLHILLFHESKLRVYFWKTK